MRFIENTLHPDRKRQQHWRQFSSEVGGIYISESDSVGDEVHIPFRGHRITLGMNIEGRAVRTVLTARYLSDDFLFRIFGWGGRTVPEMERDPYLNSEFPDLASRVKVEFNNAKKLTSLLAHVDLRGFAIAAPGYFTLEAGPGQLCLDNRAHGCEENGIITDVHHLHAALKLLKCALLGMERIGSALSARDLWRATTDLPRVRDIFQANGLALSDVA